MKILKLREDFKKMPDKNWADAQQINKMLNLGWRFAKKQEYKDSYGIKESPKVVDIVVKEKKTRTKK